MENLLKQQIIHRQLFDGVKNKLDDLLEQHLPVNELLIDWCLLQEKKKDLDKISGQIQDILFKDDNVSGEVITAEINSADEYTRKFFRIKFEIEACVQRTKNNHQSRNQEDVTNNVSANSKKLNLPTMTLIKFSGSIREWLRFWGQFKKIHLDPNISDDDKFEYLITAIVPGSKASELIERFPPTGENYQKALESLKNRFGRDDLLIEVYVRELLTLVLQNATSSNKTSLSSLYDKLESHLQALGSLGVTTDKCAAMLFPLVESSLPEEVLRAWQRTVESRQAVDSKGRLDVLMKFIGNEVEAEEKIHMATQGFGFHNESEKTKKTKLKLDVSKVPTAMELLTNKVPVKKENHKKENCIFCNGTHFSAECEVARKMKLEERQKIVKEKHRCFNCLKSGHSFRYCRTPVKCAWCKRQHVMLMCKELTKEASLNVQNDGSKEVVVSEQNLATYSSIQHVSLMTLKVILRNGKQEQVVRAIIDTGSQNSYVLDRQVNSMGYLKEREEKITHTLFGGTRTLPQNHMVYRLHLLAMNRQYACNFEARGQKVICDNIPSIPAIPELNNLKHDNIKLYDIDSNEEPISILIGADVAGKLLTGRHVKLTCGLVAIETLLGWTLMGKMLRKDGMENMDMLATSMFVYNPKISDLWDIEAIGISDPIEQKTKEIREKEAKEHFLKTVKINSDNRYEVELPWIEDHPPLPTNRLIAERRLEITTKRLKLDNYFNEYGAVFDAWLSEGIIELIPESELGLGAHYLPHRHVVREGSTTKIRPVFDASARVKDMPSLNLCLDKGANLIELIPSVLLGFREKNFGVVSDIKQAFLQISITPKERDYLRFLWWSDSTCKKMKEFRQARVVFGVSCSPFMLAAVIHFHLNQMIKDEQYSKDTLIRLKHSFYVDNCVTSLSTESELNQFIKDATEIMKKASFDLRGWEYTRQENAKEECSVLGILWNKIEDNLYLNPALINTDFPIKITKRVILSEASKMFDPIGFSCPIMLIPKLLLQKTWMWGLDWDSEVNSDVCKEFLLWKQELKELRSLKIPRKFFHGDVSNKTISLHTFCDASEHAYAAVVYIRGCTKTNEVQVQLVMAKSRIAPTKRVTIPRLELLAATIGARLTNFIITELKYESIPVWFWTDSTTVLAWIQREMQWNTFVWNRVMEIRRLTDVKRWRHVPGEINPADLPSRGCRANQLVISRWWEGPDWLRQLEEIWPSMNYAFDEEEVKQAMKKGVAIKSTELVIKSSNQEFVEPWYWRLSSYSKIIRCIGYFKRFIFRRRNPSTEKIYDKLSANEFNQAELCLIKMLQQETFTGIDDQKLRTLNPFVENGIIKLRTKIFNRPDHRDFCCPVVLDYRNVVVKALVREKHILLCHAGVQTVMNCLRENYWILSARRCVKSVISSCVICKRFSAKSLQQVSAPLPTNRVRDAMVFEIIGVDLAGPLFIRDLNKSWVVLFTCAVYRAVHLELVTSLSTNAFIDAFKRFIARRGRPAIVYSDRGTNFVGTENLLQELDWDKIMEHSTSQKIEWCFNPPSSPWWGGWWERLIRILKNLLRRVLGKTSLNYESLLTILIDCEAIINSRPITYMSNNNNDPVPITPSMFLHEIREVGIPDYDNINRISLSRRIRYRQNLTDHLRQRFRVEYLGSLFYNDINRKTRTAQVGDIVLIGDDNRKRIDWPLAKIIEIFPGKDGHIRVVKVKTQKGELIRPIQRIYPLELNVNIESELISEYKRKKDSDLGSKTVELRSEILPTNENQAVVITRSGRTVKKPERLNYR